MSDIPKFIVLATEELETAELLVKVERYRLCLSRCYYAMYYMSQALLLSEGFEASTHKGLIKLLGLHFVKTGKISNELAKSLASAYDERQMSDYNVRFEPTKDEALEAISEAQKFIKSISLMLND